MLLLKRLVIASAGGAKQSQCSRLLRHPFGVPRNDISVVVAVFLSVTLFCSFSYAEDALPFAKGETIKYTIKKFGVGGKATLTFRGQETFAGKDTYLIVFKADGFNFYDEEKIYVDTKTYAPVSVIRDLNIFGKKEKITEEYLAAEGKIKITKIAGGKTTVQTIEKKGQVDNIYGVIYRYRQSGSFKLGDQMALRLPTVDVTLKLAKMDKVKTGGKKYDAFYMESVPPQYMVWFDTSPQRIPLRITSTAGMGNTNMIITDYQGTK